MKTTLRIALLTTVATYMLIFTGGLVRVSGAGLGCPDWPRCFGRWIPPTSVAQLPPNIDPAQFNFTLAWIEYSNRCFGVIVGLFILVTALLTLKHFRKQPRIVIPAVLAALLVAYLGWQGGQVVESRLASLLVSVHAVLAILIGGLMIFVAQQIHYVMHPESEKDRVYPRRLGVWIGIALFATLLQIVLGTNMRSTLEAIQTQQTFSHGLDWTLQAGWLNWLHVVLGLLLIAPSVYLSVLILLRSQNPSPLVWQGAWAVVLLVALQGVFGFFLMISIPPILEVVHLWLAALLAGIFLLLFSALAKKEGATHETR